MHKFQLLICKQNEPARHLLATSSKCSRLLPVFIPIFMKTEQSVPEPSGGESWLWLSRAAPSPRRDFNAPQSLGSTSWLLCRSIFSFNGRFSQTKPPHQWLFTTPPRCFGPCCLPDLALRVFLGAACGESCHRTHRQFHKYQMAIKLKVVASGN